MFFVHAVGVRVRIVGTERVPSGTCLFIANHTSTVDAPAVVGAIPRRIAILLKQSLFRYPIVGQAFRLAHFIPVDRSKQESAIASLEKAIEAMRGGQSFLIYPEGTRSPDGRLQEFKKRRRGDGYQSRRADCAYCVFWRPPHYAQALAGDSSGRNPGGIPCAD